MDTLLDIARAIRRWQYDLTSTRVLGVELDVPAHFVIAFAIFAVAKRRLSTWRATYVLATAVVAKELVDLFLKSKLEYITTPTFDTLVDVFADISMGVLGGLAAWWWNRFHARASTPS